MKHITAILSFTIMMMLLFTSHVYASSQAIDAGVLASTQNHLNNIRTLKAHFTQIAPDGVASEGTLWLKRPSKMRWEYAPPVPILMVSAGTFLRYYDTELDQVSDIPMKDTLAGVLSQDMIDFNDNTLRVLHAYRENGFQSVRVTQRGKESEGELTFEYETAPLKLRSIIMKDSKGEETRIALGNAELNIPLKNSLFELYDPRMKRKRYQR